MAEDQHSPLDLPPQLDAWSGLEPDRDAMARVAACMVVAMAAAEAPRRDAHSEDSRFRTLVWVWAAGGVLAYLITPYLADWYATHPWWVILGISGGVATLLVPVLSILSHYMPSTRLTHID